MQITFDKVLPEPIANDVDSEVWGRELAFDKGIKYLIYSPSGAGKSTFLNIIFGKRNDYSGTVSISGSSVSNWAPSKWSDSRTTDLSMVFQGLRLFPELSGLENVMLNKEVVVSESELQRWFEQLGIAELSKKKAAHMSFGQRQRFAIARALAQPFEFLLLDEPFSHLDEPSASAAWDLICEICAARNAGVLLTALSDQWPGIDKKIRLQ
jgi:ABC-type lipoprotein export system ATPase subunit